MGHFGSNNGLQKFLKMQYVSRNVDTEGNKFEVKKIAWITHGYGGVADGEGQLETCET